MLIKRINIDGTIIMVTVELHHQNLKRFYDAYFRVV